MSLSILILLVFGTFKYYNLHPYDTIKTVYINSKLFFFFVKQYNMKTLLNSGRQLVTYYLSQRFTSIGKQQIDILYPYGIRWYKVRFNKKLGPSKIKQIYYNHMNVTKDIKTFMGPSNNFHGIPTTPSMLGYSSLTVRYFNGNEKIYSDDEVIEI